MKKCVIDDSHGFGASLRVIILTMKLLPILIFAGTTAESASIYSQKAELYLQIQNATVASILKDDIRQLEKLKSEVEQQQPQKKELKGKVTDAKGDPLPGSTVLVKGTLVGTITDVDGNFTLQAPVDAKVLEVSFMGYKPQEITVGNKTNFNIFLEEMTVNLEEMVVIGYGVQKKASVVGAITSTTSQELQRSGGVSNIGQALTGKLPGVTIIQTTGQPGMEDPKIYIRGQGTWNGGQPYILVDGVERRMNDLDVSEIANISVLKDASATAVYGVKGANGVILVTTKRGSIGKPQLSLSANSTLKFPSRLVDKLDAYDMLMVKNAAIEREVPLMEGTWGDYTPLEIVQRYRNQQNLKYPEAYPNVDWQDETVKDYTSDYRVNLNVTGGTDFVKYFSSLAYNNQGDLKKIRDNGRGYTPGFGYNKFNFRTNLDLNLTRTTSLKFNLAGVYSQLKSPLGTSTGYAQEANLSFLHLGHQFTPPNAFLPQYADGRWGKNPNGDHRLQNSAAMLANSGYNQRNGTDLTLDIGINQNLDFITQGLSASANLSFDNHFESIKSIVDALYGEYPTKYIYPEIEDMPAGGDPNSYIILEPVTGINQFAWIRPPWSLLDEDANKALHTLRRRLYYQVQLNYARSFEKHDVTATGVFTREELATGSEFPRYREDWVSRVTYNYDYRYFVEFNGAYNGSEKFGPKHRFAFFPSGGVGWTISNEQFMKSTENWLDKLRLRYSYGKIGDDSGLAQRWIYNTQWDYGGQLRLNQYFTNSPNTLSPYVMYYEKNVGNPDIQWETALKTNLGLEIAVLKNMLSGNFEYFTEDRTNIMLAGSQRIVPQYFGTLPPTANVGRVTKSGYEIEFRFNKNLREWYLWAETSITHVVDKVMEREEPLLLDPHRLRKGFQIDQTKTLITDGFIQTWDQVYSSTPYLSNDHQKLPGNYFVLDFDADGVIDPSADRAPYGYSDRPQNNYNFSVGANYKGWSMMLQFYGVNNVTRFVDLTNFTNDIDIAYDYTLDHWSKENPDATSFLPRWKTRNGQPDGQYFQFDGSYLRLKTAELAYTFTGVRLQKYGLSDLKLFMNGNNLLFWSKLPDDLEQGTTQFGTYPTTMRINFGVDIKF